MSPRTRRAEKKAAERQREALWSLYLTGAGISPDILSPDLRPMPRGDATRVLARTSVDLAHDDLQCLRGFLQLAKGAGNYAEALKYLHGLVGTAAMRDEIVRQIALVLTIDETAVGALADRSFVANTCLPTQEPTTTHSGISLTTTAVGEIEILRPLHTLARRLDPRDWALCGTFFEKSVHVERRRLLDYKPVKPDPTGLGENWAGLLLEEVTLPLATFRQILKIDFFSSLRDTDPRKHEIRIDYTLHDPLAIEVGFLSAAGGMRRNSGGYSRLGSASTRTGPTYTSARRCSTATSPNETPRGRPTSGRS